MRRRASQEVPAQLLLPAGEAAGRDRHGDGGGQADRVVDGRTDGADPDVVLLPVPGQARSPAPRPAQSAARPRLVTVWQVSRRRLLGSSRRTSASSSVARSALPLAVECSGNDTPTADTVWRRCGRCHLVDEQHAVAREHREVDRLPHPLATAPPAPGGWRPRATPGWRWPAAAGRSRGGSPTDAETGRHQPLARQRLHDAVHRRAGEVDLGRQLGQRQPLGRGAQAAQDRGGPGDDLHAPLGPGRQPPSRMARPPLSCSSRCRRRRPATGRSRRRPRGWPGRRRRPRSRRG